MDLSTAETAMDEMNRAQQLNLMTHTQGIINHIYSFDEVHTLKKVLNYYHESEMQSAPMFYLGDQEE
jgi:hypothetical protein